MTTVFTICSNNYLAQAKALGDSLRSQHPDFQFSIVLVDHLSELIDYRFFDPYEIIPIRDIGIGAFEEMFLKYDITELNTAVKPFIIDFLFNRSNDLERVIYFDPDIIIYDKLDELIAHLQESNIVLTPHFFTPIYDNYALSEHAILNAGLYNLGFIAVRRSEVVKQFLNWWMIKLKDYCFIDFTNGLFVDQLWINFAPLYFNNVTILRHPGYNVAYWNLHERIISQKDGKYFVNDEYPLIFYHFSGYEFNSPQTLSKYQNRFSLEERKDVLPLFRDYQNIVISNNYELYSKIECAYIKMKKDREQQSLLNREGSLSYGYKLSRSIKRKFEKIFGVQISVRAKHGS